MSWSIFEYTSIKMKAAIHAKYGPPEVVCIQEVDKPKPEKDEVLIKVFASTVNRTDCGFRSANYFISRFFTGLFRPKQQTLGCEFAGEIEAVGENVNRFKPGDKVFGYNDVRFGGHAEYMVLKESDAIGTIPENTTFEEAAAITEGSHYALNYIRAAKISKDQHVLIYGATGAIGSAAVQLIKHIGTEVTAVGNTKNVDLLHSLGADKVIDYQTEDFTKTDQKYDLVFDAVGKSSWQECKPLLKERGIYVSTELGKNSQNIFLALTTSLFGKKRVLFPIPTINLEIIGYLKNLVETKAFRPVIDRTYPLEEIVDAYRYVETGQKTGSVVVKVRNE